VKSLSYEVARKEYEKIKTKPLNLHIELALSEYQEADARILLVPSADLSMKRSGFAGSIHCDLLRCSASNRSMLQG